MTLRIGTHISQFRYQQRQLDIILERIVDDGYKASFHKMSRNSGIEYRNLSYPIDEVFEDIMNMSLADKLNASNDKGKEYALEACKKALVGYDVSQIDEVICASSTCFHAPSIDAYIAKELGLRDDILLTSISIKGCAAGGIAISNAIDKTRMGRKCLVVLVDVHSYHTIQEKNANNIPRLLEMILFSDGASAILLDKPLGLYSTKTNHAFHDNMQITFNNGNLQGVLDKNVHVLMSDLYESMNMRQFRNYLVHPGGMSILNEMKSRVSGSYDDSYETLRLHGNMSCATILFVLDSAQKNDRLDNAVMVTFGQGITCSCIELR